MEQHHLVSCPQLLNLIIKIACSDSLYGNIKILAPKLRNFHSVGIGSITLVVPELENVHIELHSWLRFMDWILRKKIYRVFTDMLSALGNAKSLTFDFNSIEALFAADFLASLPSPFYNLKIVKLPSTYKESSISGALRTYLLGGSPKATIVTTLPKNEVTQPVPLTSKKAMLDEPFATPTNVKFVVDDDRVRQIGASVAGQAMIGLALQETFKHFTARSEKFHTMMLNMLCTSVNEFLGTSMTEVSTDIITEYKDVFADLQSWGFNVDWLASHLNNVEQFLFSQHQLHTIDSRMEDAKNKLQELQTHCLKKITAIDIASV
ncbi:hypothetical protein AgCh_001730 [Apium graveolens]